MAVWWQGARALGNKAARYKYYLLAGALLTFFVVNYGGVADFEAVKVGGAQLDVPGRFRPPPHGPVPPGSGSRSGSGSGLERPGSMEKVSVGSEESYRYPIKEEMKPGMPQRPEAKIPRPPGPPGKPPGKPGHGSVPSPVQAGSHGAPVGFDNEDKVGALDSKPENAPPRMDANKVPPKMGSDKPPPGSGQVDKAGPGRMPQLNGDGVASGPPPHIRPPGMAGGVGAGAGTEGGMGTAAEAEADGWSAQELETLTSGGGQARTEKPYAVDALLPPPTLPRKDKFPVKQVIRLPRGGTKKLPRVQAATFAKRSAEDEAERQQRLARVKDAMKISWEQYRLYAWGADELNPKTDRGSSPFLGWAATIVDALDTLKIMGMEEEFEEAIHHVSTIDFTRTFRPDIPLFETVIRYLGGLLAAHDLCDSDGRQDWAKKILLDQAAVLGENLMGAFDTPNRMPLTFFDWTDAATARKYRAGRDAVFAEVTSMSVEFTRLAQLTGDDKYYDAIARITNALHEFGTRSEIPWLFPQAVDISGCQVTPASEYESESHGGAAGLPRPPPKPASAPSVAGEQRPEQVPSVEDSTAIPERLPGAEAFEDVRWLDKAPGDEVPTDRPAGPDDEWAFEEGRWYDKTTPEMEPLEKKAKRAIIPGSKSGDSSEPHRVLVGNPGRRGSIYNRAYCTPQKEFEVGAKTMNPKYTLGGQTDSAYEYYMKMHMLLQGAEPKYVELYEGMVESTLKHLVYKPRVENNDNILFSGQKIRNSDGSFRFEGEMSHLTCFVGGMFAMGGRLLNRPQDVELGAKLTDGCVWAYNRTRTGIMPENFIVDVCPDLTSECVFEPNIAAWPVAASAETSPGVTASLGPSAAPRRGSASGSRAGGIPPSGPRVGRAISNAPPAITLVADDDGGVRWPGRGTYDQPLSFHRMDPKYLLRPEALESVFYMWRITGDPTWQDKGWRMFDSILNATAIRDESGEVYGYTAINDVTDDRGLWSVHKDSAESFWMAETLKYAYLLFANTDVISLDDYVLNTEAHPFVRPRP